MFFLAKRFVAGVSLPEAVHVVEQLNQKKIKASLDLLGEDVKNSFEAMQAAQDYIEILNTIKLKNLASGASLKLTQMGLDLGKDFCLDNMRKVLTVAKNNEQFVRIDMEGSAHTQVTLDIFETLHQEFSKHVGIVLQAYLHRSLGDLERVCAFGGSVRVCKGAYKELPGLAYQNMQDIRNNYKAMVERLSKSNCHFALATHDDALISWAKTHLAALPKEKFEFQMLYGLRSKTALSLAQEGYRMRVYVPYGSHWFPYFYRRLRERKENVFFILRNLFTR